MDGLSGLVLFTLVMRMPEQEPLRLSVEMTLAQCLFEQHEFLSHPGRTVLLNGGSVTTGCTRRFEPSEEH